MDFYLKKKKLFSCAKIFYNILVSEQISMELIFFITPNGLYLTQCIKNQNAFHELITLLINCHD